MFDECDDGHCRYAFRLSRTEGASLRWVIRTLRDAPKNRKAIAALRALDKVDDHMKMLMARCHELEDVLHDFGLCEVETEPEPRELN